MMIGSISVVSISCLIQYVRSQKRQKANDALDPYFSATYHSAREKFRDAVSQIDGAKHHSIVIDTECDLSIDLCFIAGDHQSKHVVVHLSGTHGVEGYAGSAIQIHLLKHTIPQLLSETMDRERPHILFVHALNSYGMNANRRFTKSNIDLNRNCIISNPTKPDLWNEILSRDPTDSAYSKLSNIINPQRKPTWFRDDFLFWPEALQNVLLYGIKNLKKTIVEGQYHKRDGLFFGGMDLAVEHDMLIQYLTQEMMDHDKFGVDLCEMAQRLTMIDVHTGLGKYANDYLFLKSHAQRLKEMLPEYADMGTSARTIHHVMDLENDSMFKEMYKDMTGSVGGEDGYPSLFHNAVDTLSLTQEFGTKEGVFVFKALRAENMAFHYSQGESIDDERIFYQRGLDLKHVFYLEDDPFWKRQVIDSGVRLFNQLLWR